MPHVAYHDRAVGVMFADDADDLLDMYQAAQRVEVVAVEVLPAQTDEQKEAAARHCRDLAVAINAREPSVGLNHPEEWAALARRKIAVGGYVVKVTALSAAERSSRENMSLFYASLGGLRRIQGTASGMAFDEAS